MYKTIFVYTNHAYLASIGGALEKKYANLYDALIDNSGFSGIIKIMEDGITDYRPVYDITGCVVVDGGSFLFPGRFRKSGTSARLVCKNNAIEQTI